MRSVRPEALPHGDDARYHFERTLGQGGAGAVYLVRDRETGEQLALKKLLRMDAKSVLRLKREFRSLADMNHPNLVKLFDMGSASDAWFLTMEYIEGTDLLSYIDRKPPPGMTSSQRIVSTFRQLAEGVHALHRAGMLHRDLKPSNVLVSEQGRVVVLDFGLVRELGEADSKLTEDGSIAGTPAYMAPEQALNHTLDAACDWYAFGVMLYEALSGELPFDGGTMQVLRMKLAIDPPAIETLAPDTPRALVELCSALLRRAPNERPNGETILRALAPAPVPLPLAPDTTLLGETTLQTESQARQPAAAELFGRSSELDALWNAFDRTEEGRSFVVHVRGASGAGKSALVEHFLKQLEEQHRGVHGSDVLALRSRCYEREAMPFKALDGVMDALVRHLAGLDDLEVSHLLPTDIGVLARLFPVLERLHAVQRLLNNARARTDAVQDRQRAEQALRELFGRLATRIPLVLWIDDLQWGDLDSASILGSWLEQPHRAPLLLVFSYRSDEVTTSSCLQHLLAAAAQGGEDRAPEHTIALAPLTGADVEALCAQRLGAHARAEVVETIVREAQGSPFLAFQLAALAEAKIQRGDGDLGALSLDDLVEQTGALLPNDAKLLLGTLAVAGRPMLPRLALRAAGIKRDGRSILHALRGLNLVRTREVGGERLVEVYHDRVRERVQSGLTPEQRQRVHENLLRALEFSGQAEPDWLHTLALGAGQRAQALHYGLLAAERASATLAFERAAELYQQSLELSQDSAAQGGELWRKLAFALACCGRGSRAGDAYLEAAKTAPPQEVVELTRTAASHLLRSGRFEEGEAQIRKVLDAMEVRVPETENSMIAAIVWERTRLSIRGMGYRARSEPELPASLLAQVDLYDALRIDTQSYDPVRAALFQLRGLRLALEAGEPRRIVRALCSAANIAAVSGSANGERRTHELLARATELARQVGDEHERGNVCAARAVCAFLLGRPKEVLEPSYEAERILRADSRQGAGAYFVRLAAVSSRIGALHILGENKRFKAEFAATLNEARVTENLSAELQLLLNHTIVEEIDAQAERSIPRLERQREQLPKARFGILHALHLVAVMRAACANANYAWADQYLAEVWPAYLRSPVRHTAFLAMAVHSTRARLLLNRRAVLGDASDPERLVRDDCRVVAKLPFRSCKPTLERVQARIALARGDRAAAMQLLRKSPQNYDAGDILDEAMRDRYALGLLVGGAEGEGLCTAAMQRMRDSGYVNPARELRGYYPELIG